MNHFLRRGGAVLLAVGLVTVAFGGLAAAHGGDDGMHHHDGWMGSHDGWMGAPIGVGGAGLLWPLLWLVVLVGAGVLAYRSFVADEGATGPASGDSALAVLRERYARGEIDSDEFERRREQLSRRRESP